MKVILKNLRAYFLKQANFQSFMCFETDTHALCNGVEVLFTSDDIRVLDYQNNKSYIATVLEGAHHEEDYVCIKYEYKDGKLYIYQTNGISIKSGLADSKHIYVFCGSFIISGLSEEEAQIIMFKYPLQLVSMHLNNWEIQRRLSNFARTTGIEIKQYNGMDCGSYNFEDASNHIIEASEHLENDTALWELIAANPVTFERYKNEYYEYFGSYVEFGYDPYGSFKREGV